MRQCYALAAEEADEHGRIRGGGAKGFADEDDDDEFGDIDFGGSGASGGGRAAGKVALSGDVVRRVEGLERVLSASRRVGSSLEVGAVMAAIMEEATHLVDCARAEIYLIDANAKMLTPFEAGSGNRLPGIPQGKSGIPGAVVQKGRVLNVPDVYEHADFDASGDQASGTKTTCLLGAPILGQDGVPVAVLVALNKNGGGVFDRADEEVMVVFATSR